MAGKMYRIGEAAALLGLKSYVLRFWETEFPQLDPVRTEKGQRLYTEEHIELLKLIKQLLHGRGLTIDGARRILNSPDSQKTAQEENSQTIASEFSSELLLGRDFLDEEYEDDEPADNFNPRLDSVLLEAIEDLEEIRALLAPLDNGEENGDEFDELAETVLLEHPSDRPDDADDAKALNADSVPETAKSSDVVSGEMESSPANLEIDAALSNFPKQPLLSAPDLSLDSPGSRPGESSLRAEAGASGQAGDATLSATPEIPPDPASEFGQFDRETSSEADADADLSFSFDSGLTADALSSSTSPLLPSNPAAESDDALILNFLRNFDPDQD